MTVARLCVSPAFLIRAFSAPLPCLSLHIHSTSFLLLASQGVQTADQGLFLLPAPRAKGGCYLSSLDSRPQEMSEPHVPLLHSRQNSRGSHKKATKVVWAPRNSLTPSHPPHSDLPSPLKLSGSKLSVGILAQNLHNPFFHLIPRPPLPLPPCQGPEYFHSLGGSSCLWS